MIDLDNKFENLAYKEEKLKIANKTIQELKNEIIRLKSSSNIDKNNLQLFKSNPEIYNDLSSAPKLKNENLPPDDFLNVMMLQAIAIDELLKQNQLHQIQLQQQQPNDNQQDYIDYKNQGSREDNE